MQFQPLILAGAWLVRPERSGDDRGFFARTICVREFAAHGLNGRFVQSSISWNRQRGTLRGMHFQWPPSDEAKLVRCTRGSILDILIDLRPGSGTFMQHQQISLTDASRDAVYIPAGFAHGFQTLQDDVEVEYHMTDEFRPELASGFRWNDPAFQLSLAMEVTAIAPRDAAYPDFEEQAYEREFEARSFPAAPPR